jgi:GNAT superfamily N-acetyltransferase
VSPGPSGAGPGPAGRADALATLELGASPIVLRPAVRADLPALVALLAADDLGATRDGIRNEADRAAYEQAFRAIDADPAQLLMVAETGDRVVATLQLSFLPGLSRRGALRAQIESVRVSPAHRGQGLGEAIFTWAIGEARRHGCALVQLPTDNSRSGAHRFYDRLGFVASHEGLKLALH